MKPLGPFNGKSFATSISPWVITPEALEPFACEPPPKDFEPRPHLRDSKAKSAYDVKLGASFIVSGIETKVCSSELKSMYWTFRDAIVQQTVNGCSINTGDLLATGTVSGSGELEKGCLLEATHGGKKRLLLDRGQERVWLQDGDEVMLTGYAGPGVGFGECSGILLPARTV